MNYIQYFYSVYQDYFIILLIAKLFKILCYVPVGSLRALLWRWWVDTHYCEVCSKVYELIFPTNQYGSRDGSAAKCNNKHNCISAIFGTNSNCVSQALLDTQCVCQCTVLQVVCIFHFIQNDGTNWVELVYHVLQKQYIRVYKLLTMNLRSHTAQETDCQFGHCYCCKWPLYCDDVRALLLSLIQDF